jgi:thioesterase domain-containing protein
LFAVHAVGGTVFGYAPLAKEIAGTFKVYGIEAAGLADGSTPAASLSSIVDSYVDAIRTVQPGGPYMLAGWSMGGIVAYELAGRFEELGEEVALLALLDAPSSLPDRPRPPERELAALFVADACRTLGWPVEDSPGAGPPAADQLAWLAYRLVAGGGEAGALRAQLERRYAVFKALNEMVTGYRPRVVVHADTLLVGAERSPNDVGPWSRVLDGKVRSIRLPYDHYTLLQPAGSREIAAALLNLT